MFSEVHNAGVSRARRDSILFCSLFGPSGQGAGQAFGQQGVYNNMSITVSMAGGSSGVSSLPPMGQPVAMSNSNLNNVGDQQVGVLSNSNWCLIFLSATRKIMPKILCLFIGVSPFFDRFAINF